MTQWLEMTQWRHISYLNMVQNLRAIAIVKNSLYKQIANVKYASDLYFGSLTIAHRTHCIYRGYTTCQSYEC